jgi:hypothetical protein
MVHTGHSTRTQSRATGHARGHIGQGAILAPPAGLLDAETKVSSGRAVAAATAGTRCWASEVHGMQVYYQQRTLAREVTQMTGSSPSNVQVRALWTYGVHCI